METAPFADTGSKLPVPCSCAVSPAVQAGIQSMHAVPVSLPGLKKHLMAAASYADSSLSCELLAAGCAGSLLSGSTDLLLSDLVITWG